MSIIASACARDLAVLLIRSANKHFNKDYKSRDILGPHFLFVTLIYNQQNYLIKNITKIILMIFRDDRWQQPRILVIYVTEYLSERRV